VSRGPSKRVKIIAGVSSFALLAAGIIGYKLLDKGPPSFRRGGDFAIAGPPSSTTTFTADPSTTTTIPAAVPGTAAPAPSSTTTTRRPSTSATTVTTRRAATTATTRATSGPAPTATVTGPTQTTPAPDPRAAPAGPGKPALGTYTWKVDGTEGASFVGSRRFPEQMTMVVHAGAGVEADQLVFDLTYSDKHAERQIVGFRNDGIYFDFEGGSVTFGPRTETSQADYEPPIVQIPLPLQPGLSRTGVTKAKGANGGVSRTEDWKTTVIGQEPVTVAGTTVNAWKVEVQRKFRPGTPDQGHRNRTMWFDPARNIWVKFVEVFHGERHQAGFSFTYDSNVTAVLAGYTP
jgi:hypothetical protein